jgi:hypothetical protein
MVAVNAEEEPQAASRHGVEFFPTLAFFKGGKELRRLRGGALPPSTLQLLAQTPPTGSEGPRRAS